MEIGSLQNRAICFLERMARIPLDEAKAAPVCIHCGSPVEVSFMSEIEKLNYEVSGVCRDCRDALALEFDLKKD